jgi:uncharacterized membrane protein
MKRKGNLGCFLVVLMGAASSGCTTNENSGSAGAVGEVSFTREVKPILEKRCLPCHSGTLMPGMLDMRSRDAVFAARRGGAVIVPGDPEASRLFHKMSLEDDQTGAMPPTGHALSAEEQRVLTEWIRQGAEWPSGPEGQLRARRGAEPRSI